MLIRTLRGLYVPIFLHLLDGAFDDDAFAVMQESVEHGGGDGCFGNGEPHLPYIGCATCRPANLDLVLRIFFAQLGDLSFIELAVEQGDVKVEEHVLRWYREHTNHFSFNDAPW